MTACITVADVFALSANPARLSQSDLRRAFGIGYGRARVLHALAVAEQQRRALAPPNPLGLSPDEVAAARALGVTLP